MSAAVMAVLTLVVLLALSRAWSPRGIPFVGRLNRWSIGLYAGDSPLHLRAQPGITNPVLSYKDVTDAPAVFVADPFMVREESTWYMFFEVMNARTKQGDIGLAQSSDGLSWAYQKIVLDEPFHLSYPQVFAWKGSYYMIPETHQASAVRIYKAEKFPEEWTFVATLLEGSPFTDPTVFRAKEKWWLFSTTPPSDTLRLFVADDLLGPWSEHPESPVVRGDAHQARPAGRVVVAGDSLLRFAQDDLPVYGHQVRAFEILELTPAHYQEREVGGGPILKGSGSGWNAERMHHTDPHPMGDGRWVACVDGSRRVLVFGLGY